MSRGEWWTGGEDEALRQAHADGRHPTLTDLHALFPGRTFAAVKRRAFKLGIRYGAARSEHGSLRMQFTYTFAQDERAYLETAARIRKLSLRALLARVVKAVIAEQLVGAVLDDLPADGAKSSKKTL